MKKLKGIIAVLVTVICSMCLFTFTSSAAEEGKWITAWSTAATEVGLEDYSYVSAVAQNVAIRTVITPAASGSEIRVKFSNAYGKDKTELVIDRAWTPPRWWHHHRRAFCNPRSRTQGWADPSGADG